MGEKCTKGFGGKNTRERDHSDNLGVEGRMTSVWLKI
jgi:hypothetical protein